MKKKAKIRQRERERGQRGQRGGQEDIFGGKKTTGLLEIRVAK